MDARDFDSQVVDRFCRLNKFIGSDALGAQIVNAVTELMNVDDVLLVDLEGDLMDPIEHSEGWSPDAHTLEVIRKSLAVESGFWCQSLESASGVRFSFSARLDCGGKAIGALYCDDRSGNRRCSEEDGLRLKTLADLLAVYIDDLHSRRQYDQKSAKDHPDPDMDHVLIGETPVMKALKTEIRKIAALSSVPVLIRGERGCGKEIVASLIHSLSDRKEKEFVIVHSAAIPKELFESELFGHEKGAFTGATARREGKIRIAEGGTLFLDEIGDTPPEFQIKLLRLLQTRTFYRVGSDVPVGPVNVRFLFATNRDLERMMEEGMLREDFYDRISMGRVLYVPSLRQRREDTAALARYFAVPQGISYDAIKLLMSVQDWPGNVRQLEAVVRAAGSSIPEELIPLSVIEKELALRKLSVLEGVASSNEFAVLRQQYKEAVITSEQLGQTLFTKLSQFRTWSKVARSIGCRTQTEVKSFQQWIHYLQKTGILPKGRKHTERISP